MNKLERRGLKLKKRVGDAKCDDKNNYQYNIHNLKTLRKWKQLLCDCWRRKSCTNESVVALLLASYRVSDLICFSLIA